jgi:hypothetical protein
MKNYDVQADMIFDMRYKNMAVKRYQKLQASL